jgi:hypothetical protein
MSQALLHPGYRFGYERQTYHNQTYTNPAASRNEFHKKN